MNERLRSVAEEMERAARDMETDGATVDASWIRGMASLIKAETEDE